MHHTSAGRGQKRLSNPRNRGQRWSQSRWSNMNLECAEQSSVTVPLPWPLCPEPHCWASQLYTNSRNPIQAQGLKLKASKHLKWMFWALRETCIGLLWVLSYLHPASQWLAWWPSEHCSGEKQFASSGDSLLMALASFLYRQGP